MRRRKFLQQAAHAFAIPGVVSSFGFNFPSQASFGRMLRKAAESDRVLVLVFLDGGNDGLNTIVPFSELSAMHEVRPHVVLPEERLLPITGTGLGFHPALSGFQSLYREGRLGIIQSVGYPNPNYSHFRSTDIWMSGSDSDQYVNTGWTGRYLNKTAPDYPVGYPSDDEPDPLAIEIGYGASLMFQGPAASMGMVISGPESFYDLVEMAEPDVPDSRLGEKLGYLRLIARQSQQYGVVVRDAAQRVTKQRPYPGTELGEQLKVVSRLIAGGMRTPLYMVRIGGFDTHDGQVVPGDTTTGFHAELLQQVNDAIVAFLNDLDFQGNAERVIGMTFSEFGRTIISNASDGTDHGSVAPMFLFGNQVRGGILGKDPIVPRTANNETELPMQYDYRQIYASVLEQWLGMDKEDVDEVLLQEFERVLVIGEDNVITGLRQMEEDLLVYPNPLNSQANIRFTGMGEPYSLDLYDLNGRMIQSIAKGRSMRGRNVLQWETSLLRQGRYFVILTTPQEQRSFSVVK